MEYSHIPISHKFVDRKVIIRLKDRVCENSEELLNSSLFFEILERFVKQLQSHESPLLDIFAKPADDISSDDLKELTQVFIYLGKMPSDWVSKLLETTQHIFTDTQNLYLFVEALYNYWREFERFVVCDSAGDGLDKRPYRTFNDTVEKLIHLVRGTYRDIQENITGKHPIIYRQVSAGAEISTIALPKEIDLPAQYNDKLAGIPFIRQILLYPPLLLNPPMNKRTGAFQRVDQNPLDLVDLDNGEWLCYPARVGAQLILVYFHEKFFELGFSLSNLFELADDEALKQKPDAVYLYGVPGDKIDGMAELPTVFYDDEENDILIGAIPARNEFGYFGYLKKMILTLHNIKAMKRDQMPYHGAMVQILLKNNKSATILIIGDTGTGKSETLEAFKTLSAEKVRDIVIIADDMGSLAPNENGNIIGYGTETGAFVRLDDLQPGYAFGQLDRTIIMSPAEQNARVILPVTTYENIVKGFPVDFVLYANNYESVDETHPIIERLDSADNALKIFRDGAAMSKGTTTTTGLVHTYFVNVFGALQYREQHDEIAGRFFDAFYKNDIFVGQLRTQLGIPGWERSGPEAAANALLEMIENQ